MKTEIKLSRRQFIENAAAVTALGSVLTVNKGLAEDVVSEEVKIDRKIKTGFIGGGGRGKWIAELFRNHGGYEPVAVADYFKPVSDALGAAVGLTPDKCFDGLSGYRKVIESGIEALIIEDVPYFYPEQAAAAVDAGLHVYIAKPVAVDVPGCMAVAAAGKAATNKKLVFLVDYQIPTDPINIDVAQRIRDGGLGKLAHVQTYGVSNGFADPPKTGTIESRLQHLIWVNDNALGCGNIGNFDIHAIDAAVWVLGKRPVSAMGLSRTCRDNPHGDSSDVVSVVYEYADGVVHNHYGQALKNNLSGRLSATFAGNRAYAEITYWGKSFMSGGPKHFGGGEVANLYKAGAERNIAEFYRNVTGGRFENETVSRAVDGTLTCVLGREAAAKGCKLTMDELLKENKKLEVDLTGLKA